MQRLIDATALLEELRELCRWHAENAGEFSILQRAIRIVHEQPTTDIDDVPQWIPCSERLPKRGTNVLITNDKGNVSYGRYRGVYPIDDDKVWWTWKKNTLENVLAWMPLPKPYEVDNE